MSAVTERPCRYCIANWAGITTRHGDGEPIRPEPDDCEFAHQRNDQPLYDLATAFARACCGTRTPTDEQIGWFLGDAEDVVGDFDSPERWHVRKLPASPNDYDQGVEQRLRINDVTYVALEGGKDSRGNVVRLSTFRAQERAHHGHTPARPQRGAARPGRSRRPRLRGRTGAQGGRVIRLTDPARFGTALRSMQAAAGITVTELAARVDCTRPHISNLRWGFVPSYELLIQLADALGYDLALIPREDSDA